MILANFRHPAACLVAVGESGLYASGVRGVERVLAVRLLLDARRGATRVQLHAAELILGRFYIWNHLGHLRIDGAGGVFLSGYLTTSFLPFFVVELLSFLSEILLGQKKFDKTFLEYLFWQKSD